MNRYYYDFHIHSCLSPCGDNDMTPNNIAGMAMLAGLNIVALTDHNTCKNCPAFFAAAEKNGIVPVAGMELTTAEEIHVLCLFERLEDAMAFDAYVTERRMKVKNNVKIFGDQLILDARDEVIGADEYYLPAATGVMLDETPALVGGYGGVAYPAHIDREANGVIAILGAFPANEGFLNAEFQSGENRESYAARYPILRQKRTLVSSDAHNLWSIRDKSAYLELDDEPYSGDKIRAEIFRLLRQPAGGE